MALQTQPGCNERTCYAEHVRVLIRRALPWAVVLLAWAPISFAQDVSLLAILGDELERNFSALKQKADPPPYFIACGITDLEYNVVAATLGALQSDSHRHSRLLDVTVRVGGPELDNYHPIRGERVRFTSGRAIALEDNPDAVRQSVWLETDRVYRLAAQRLIKIETENLVKVAEEDAPPDFSLEEPSIHTEKPPELSFSAGEWAARLRRLSKEFASYPEVLSSGVTVTAQREIKYLVNTEDTRLMHGRTSARLQIFATAKAPDGMDLTSSESFEANQASGLPSDEVVLEAIRRLATDLTILVDAPVVEPFVGPAILSGRAAGVFFHEIFGHRVEGHRQKDVTEGQTFTKSVGTRVLPEFLSVTFDPTQRIAGDTDLMGWYSYDDEGVKARRVPVVEDGIMKTFLMSRSPIRGFASSNGHGRRQAGAEVVSRQSNLIVESTKQVSDARLREMLIEEAKRQGKEYGYYFQHVTGGYTQTGRRGIQAFKVIPLVVYRVWTDGRPDEPVRGADIVGTPLASFSKITATGDEPGIFNGYCGAESGNVPVSAISPPLLISELEIQKKETSQDRPPLLPRPFHTGERK